ncbi:plasmid stabilization protein [Mesorhizobium sp.]|uniref:FitA-like ribbon-helix-helix domain-containing protein n=1 Tax=Mesorhizobium sp. TaxID=1871066 RepID=UPI000FE94081|nr:plasmid stabilization protein [Mesorhizobium sp.]RWK41945.1 MAG: plasmid stabilization protein [Mesorhizobium sp.]RWK62649.1 MAG: plasmid stabilization protein [Mesorhizobium sp.]RWK71956.1 MAG: plasmid stabilization protein [Mesorhizobium sp.]RWK74770.1 MAG: plasmid stabilization protein [Mesorhizobium sp.]RWK99913.1 MAG: plasmid stabilization protein [Mesorhizobium sp.]
MGTLTIRNLDDSVKQKLRERAAARGVSMEEEARSVLAKSVLSEGSDHNSQGVTLYTAIRHLVEPYGGFDIELPERGPARKPPKFD